LPLQPPISTVNTRPATHNSLFAIFLVLLEKGILVLPAPGEVPVLLRSCKLLWVNTLSEPPGDFNHDDIVFIERRFRLPETFLQKPVVTRGGLC
jgi:hypothetical protein